MKLINLPGELAKEAHRILSEYTTGTAAYGIGLKLYEMVTSVEHSPHSQCQTATNLNFWQACQAMRKRGVWIAHNNGERETFEIASCLLDEDFRGWHIVPKCPRYKVGDRFEDNHDVVREIVYVDSITGDYCVKIIVEGKTTGIQCCSCAYLDTLTKLPS